MSYSSSGKLLCCKLKEMNGYGFIEENLSLVIDYFIGKISD